MEPLADRSFYTPAQVEAIEAMGNYAISVANRWLLGWPKLVAKHLKAQTYLSALQLQVDQESDVLAEASDLKHLARHEILQIFGVPAAPPAVA